MGWPRRLSLWRRNLLGAVVAAAAIAVLVAVDVWPQWRSYREAVEPRHVVAPRQSLTVDGQTWAVGEVRHLGRNPVAGAPPLPEGTVLTVVTLDRSGPAPPDAYCIGVLTDGQRRWRGDTFSVPGDAGAGSCARPGRLRWSFVVPDNAVPTAVDVTTVDRSILLRLQL
jgi:hypothetical protein